jgi:hypothetical protein
VARSDWGAFCAAFSGQHRGWLATLEVFAPGGASGPRRVLAAHMPLREVVWDEGGEPALRIRLGDGREGLVHTPAGPLRIRLRETEAGAHAGLRVEAEGGMVSVLAFRVPARPETLDGLAEAEL